MVTKSLKEKYSDFLSKDEELKYVTGYSQIYLRELFAVYFLLPGALSALTGFILIYLGRLTILPATLLGLVFSTLVSLIITVAVNVSHKYLLTDRRVIMREGFFKIKLTSILYDKVTHLTVNQGFLERFVLEYGTVIIDTAGSSGDELILKFVASPIKFKNKLENLINEHQEKTSHKHEQIPKIQTKTLPVSKLFHPFADSFIDLYKR